VLLLETKPGFPIAAARPNVYSSPQHLYPSSSGGAQCPQRKRILAPRQLGQCFRFRFL